MNVLGYTITPTFPEFPVNSKTIVNTINPHSYCVAQKDDLFREALHSSDFLLPDGIGIVLAAKLLRKKNIEKIAGYDLFLNLMKKLEKNKGTVFFLGAAPETLLKIEEKVQFEFPNVKVFSFSPPYKSKFSLKDNDKMFGEINKIKPDVLFVGMTAPKQEKWVYQNKNKIDARIIASIGAVFDFYAGTVKRPSQFWIKLGLEWLPRFLKEPKRLAERNLISTPKFIFEVFKAKLISN